MDGYEVGQHPLVSRLLMGVFNTRPPQQRYNSTWDVSIVLTWMEGLGENEDLSLSDLTLKLVMLLSLTRPSRSAYLPNLDVRYRRYFPERVIFRPVAFATQARQNKERAAVPSVRLRMKNGRPPNSDRRQPAQVAALHCQAAQSSGTAVL